MINAVTLASAVAALRAKLATQPAQGPEQDVAGAGVEAMSVTADIAIDRHTEFAGVTEIREPIQNLSSIAPASRLVCAVRPTPVPY